jgi:hypothetical protein
LIEKIEEMQADSRTQPIPMARSVSPNQNHWWFGKHNNNGGYSQSHPGNGFCDSYQPDPKVPIALPGPGDERKYRDDWGLGSSSNQRRNAGFHDFSAPERILTANFSALSI